VFAEWHQQANNNTRVTADAPFTAPTSSLATLNSTVALHQIAVVMAVEYPRPEIWRFFSHSILLKSGKSVYCGPADQALEEVARLDWLDLG